MWVHSFLAVIARQVCRRLDCQGPWSWAILFRSSSEPQLGRISWSLWRPVGASLPERLSWCRGFGAVRALWTPSYRSLATSQTYGTAELSVSSAPPASDSVAESALAAHPWSPWTRPKPRETVLWREGACFCGLVDCFLSGRQVLDG